MIKNKIEQLAEKWIGTHVPDRKVANAFQLSFRSDDGEFDFSAGIENENGKLCNQDSVFDIASLTKPIVSTLALIAIDKGLVNFDSKVSDRFPTFNGNASLLNLLNHSSGLPAWDKFYERYDLQPTIEQAVVYREKILSEILNKSLEPFGLVSTYSDLGYILLGHWMEELFGKPLDDIVAEEISSPLGLETLRYVNLNAGQKPIESVPTEINPARQFLNKANAVKGVVHDENCFIQGGVCGHAGLFGTAKEMMFFGEHIRTCLDENAVGIVKSDTISFALSEKARVPGGHYYAGWDMPSGKRSSAGSYFSSEHTFGHLGFTGTSIWIERSKKLVVALFTNRVFPTRENDKILPFRIAIHDAIAGDEK